MTWQQTPADDIAIQFYDNGKPAYGIRIASRHGHETAPRILAGIKPLLRPGVTLRCWLESPSRFAEGGGDPFTQKTSVIE